MGSEATGVVIPLERIEMVSWEKGWEEKAEPMWRIVLNGYCADFPSEQAARNFADQIVAVKPSAEAFGKVEEMDLP